MEYIGICNSVAAAEFLGAQLPTHEILDEKEAVHKVNKTYPGACKIVTTESVVPHDDPKVWGGKCYPGKGRILQVYVHVSEYFFLDGTKGYAPTFSFWIKE